MSKEDSANNTIVFGGLFHVFIFPMVLVIFAQVCSISYEANGLPGLYFHFSSYFIKTLLLFLCLRSSRRTIGLPRCTMSISPSNSPLRPISGHGAHQRGMLSFDKDYFINDETNVNIYLDVKQVMIHHHPFLYYHLIPLTFYSYFRFVFETGNAEWSYCGSRCGSSFNLHRYLRLKRLYYALFTSFLSIAHYSTRS